MPGSYDVTVDHQAATGRATVVSDPKQPPEDDVIWNVAAGVPHIDRVKRRGHVVVVVVGELLGHRGLLIERVGGWCCRAGHAQRCV